MADIDLKTETPDTSLPSTGFLFGADSQSAASPSVYSTQAVATALLGSTSLTGATVTADAPVLNLAQTWNNAAVTFTGLKFNVPTDSSASGSLLMDLQVGGSSRFSVSKSGILTVVGTSGGNNIAFGPFGNIVNATSYVIAQINGTQRAGVTLATGSAFSWGSGNLTVTDIDLTLTRRAAANLRLGAADAAAPVAQTLSVQSVVAGTSNTAGANLTITGSQGTGTGAGGSIIFQVAPAGASGTAQNALATALTINADRSVTLSGSQLILGPNTYNSFTYGSGGEFNTRILGVIYNQITSIGTFIASSGVFGWASGSLSTSGTTADVMLFRDAANTLALRNGTNAQTFRVYSTFTDASNYERGALNAGADFIELAAETAGTGDDNLDVRLTPAGTGNVRFGTHTGTADTAVSGYIEIKDSGGTIRKLAVIS